MLEVMAVEEAHRRNSPNAGAEGPCEQSGGRWLVGPLRRDLDSAGHLRVPEGKAAFLLDRMAQELFRDRTFGNRRKRPRVVAGGLLRELARMTLCALEGAREIGARESGTQHADQNRAEPGEWAPSRTPAIFPTILRFLSMAQK